MLFNAYLLHATAKREGFKLLHLSCCLQSVMLNFDSKRKRKIGRRKGKNKDDGIHDF
jgi:hypothetical protein